jgi:hypothetical protein
LWQIAGTCRTAGAHGGRDRHFVVEDQFAQQRRGASHRQPLVEDARRQPVIAGVRGQEEAVGLVQRQSPVPWWCIATLRVPIRTTAARMTQRASFTRSGQAGALLAESLPSELRCAM